MTTGLDRSSMWFVGIAGVQAIWLAAWMSRGWFYQDDLTFLSQATGRSLGLAYLTDPVNDHLTPGLRLTFWMLRPLGLDHYWVSILVRVILQAVTTVLLGRLLVTLVGDRPAVRWVVAGYAFSPLLLGPVWLSCAANVLPAQLFVVLGVTAHVRYTRTGRMRSAAWAGIAFLLAAMFWELSAVDLLLLPLLSLGFLHHGPPRPRLRAACDRWPGWALTLLPVAVFTVAYAVGGYGASARAVTVETLLGAWWREWVETVAPMSVGGPWRWWAPRDVYLSATDTPIAAMWLVQAAFLGAVVASVLRSGWNALLAWAMPVVSVLGTATIVAVGRYHEFGFVSTRQVTYAFDAAIPLALAICLAFLSPAGHHGAHPSVPHRRRSSTPRRPTIALAAVAVIIFSGAVLSSVQFTSRWRMNPTQPYVRNLQHDIAARPAVSLFDTPLPTSVLPYFQPDRYLSDVLPLIGVSAATANDGPDPLIVDGAGRITDAVFLPATRAVIGANSFCGDLYRGAVDRIQPLPRRPSRNEWFVRIDYFQQHPTIGYVTLIDASGREFAPASGARVVFDGTLATQYLRFPSASPEAVRIRTTTQDNNLCVTAIVVGYPFPQRAK